jgi:hypothetical protein
MSIAAQVALEVVAGNGGDPRAGVHRDELRQLTAGRYAWVGANGALFGFRYPWMVKVGEMRYLTEHGRRRLGI